MELVMSKFVQVFFKGITFAVASLVLISSILFAGWTSVNALSNPLAGKPLSFDEMLPYLGDKQPVFRSGIGDNGDNGDNPLQIVIEPSDDNDEIVIPKEKMNIEDIFGSEQVFPFEPGIGNGGRT